MITLTITNQVKVPYIGEDLDNLIYNSLTILNPKWIENNRLDRFNWNTPKKLYFYEEKGKEDLFVPRGFLPNLIKYCEANDVEYKINDQTYIYDSIDFKFSGKLKPFQKPVTKIMLSEDIGTLCAPTGSGKTVIALYIISKRRQPTIILVHTKELLYQWIDRIQQFLNIDNNQIGRIGDGSLDENKNITVALIQTLRNYPEIINQYSHLIIDENHRIPSKTHTDIVSQFSGKYILGLSATPFRNDKLDRVIFWYAGPILHKIEPRELIKEGHITGIKTIIRKTEFISSLEDPSAEYSTLLKELSLDKERNLMIVNDVIEATESGETCLILSDRKAHCERLQDLISSQHIFIAIMLLNNYTSINHSIIFLLSCLHKEISKIKCIVLTGDVKPKPRKEIVKQVNNGEIQVLICTGQLIGEGFDCKNLSALFLTLPIKFSGRIVQYLGRVLRSLEGKDRALVYDYLDKNINCLYGSFRTRQKEYRKLEV